MLTTILTIAVIILLLGVLYLNSKSNNILEFIEEMEDYQRDLYNMIKDNENTMNKNNSISFALHGAELYKNFEKQNLVKTGGKVFLVETDWRNVSKLIPTKEVHMEKPVTEETRHTMFEGKRYEYKVKVDSSKSLGAVCGTKNNVGIRLDALGRA